MGRAEKRSAASTLSRTRRLYNPEARAVFHLAAPPIPLYPPVPVVSAGGGGGLVPPDDPEEPDDPEVVPDPPDAPSFDPPDEDPPTGSPSTRGCVRVRPPADPSRPPSEATGGGGS